MAYGALGDAYGELNKNDDAVASYKKLPPHLKMMKPVLRNFVPCRVEIRDHGQNQRSC